MRSRSKEMAELFTQEGPLAQAIEGFTERAVQIAMAEVVALALARRERCVIEAGTGIGKTFAYLVPALLAGKRVIVSTGTRTLQDQLFHRDLPMIAKALGRPARVAMLKGRANYLCLHRLELAEREFAMSPRTRESMRTLNRIRQWSLQTHSGDIGEASTVSEHDSIWLLITSTRDNCLGADCPKLQRCHVAAARREAQAADVVVVNHYLLMADLLLKERGFGDLLPGADAIIIDEAHQLPEVAEQFLGFALSTRQIQHLCRDVQVELQMQKLASESLAITLRRLEMSLASSVDTLRSERSESRNWPHAFADALAELARLLQELGEQLASIEDAPGLAAAQARAEEFAERLHAMQEEDSHSVRWAQTNTAQGFSVHYAPIDIADAMAALFDAYDAAWIFTSATLAVAGDFAHFERRIGLRDARHAIFGSPFDYAAQALLYLPRDLDEPSSPHHTRQVIDAALPVLAASGGRAFLLFTSHRALKTAAQHLRQLWHAPPYPLFVQGEVPRDVLLQRFRAAGNGVLLGTGSFWEGVDVKGLALVVVVIDKLPFAVPDDPVLKARLAATEARGGNAFFEEQVPQAAIALKQGVGRLIRDAADFGVVMIGDRRLTAKGYGRLFLESLPPMTRTHRIDEVTAFLRAHLQEAGVEATA